MAPAVISTGVDTERERESACVHFVSALRMVCEVIECEQKKRNTRALLLVFVRGLQSNRFALSRVVEMLLLNALILDHLLHVLQDLFALRRRLHVVSLARLRLRAVFLDLGQRRRGRRSNVLATEIEALHARSMLGTVVAIAQVRRWHRLPTCERVDHELLALVTAARIGIGGRRPFRRDRRRRRDAAGRVVLFGNVDDTGRCGRGRSLAFRFC